MLKDFFESCGYETYTNNNASDVFEIVEQKQPDLILLDYLLKGINGGEICHQLKTSHIARHIPVMLLSAYPRVLLSLGLYGCDRFIPKPFDLSMLTDEVKQLLHNDQTDAQPGPLHASNYPLSILNNNTQLKRLPGA
jgi:CheY-like chemotaxis protein